MAALCCVPLLTRWHHCNVSSIRSVAALYYVLYISARFEWKPDDPEIVSDVPVRRRERDEHRADDVPDAGLRGPRAPADLTRPHDRRHHALPRPLHIGT